jgi:penicillin amidase
MKNPKQGYLSSANQIPVDATYPYYHYDRGYEHYRNRRLNQKLETLENITVEDMMRLQNDNFWLMASEILPNILDSLNRNNMTEAEKIAFDALSNWNYMADQAAIAPAYFEILWNDLYRNLWDEFYDTDKSVRKPELPVTLQILKDHPDEKFIDILNTDKKEKITDLYRMSFSSAVDSVENWKSTNEKELIWSNFKNTTIQHLARLAPFSTENIQNGGNKHILNATSGRHGPSWRMVVSLEAPIKAYGVYPGGQSGNPGSYYYDNLIKSWSNGEYYELENKSTASDLKNIIFTQTLTPKAK